MSMCLVWCRHCAVDEFPMDCRTGVSSKSFVCNIRRQSWRAVSETMSCERAGQYVERLWPHWVERESLAIKTPPSGKDSHREALDLDPRRRRRRHCVRCGNRNAGHEFTDVAGRKGAIGRKLCPEERYAIIEYLKTQ
ncbi:MAG TPA: hypothetical protein VHU82_01230 [Vicinamibacterales bacterium]|nr:hypothetical protein [Vicinamibacterales bacterium]